MAINITTFIKGLLIKQDSTLTPNAIQITPAGTASTTTTITSSQTGNVTLTLPNATDTLVGKATTDTLTNKTLTSPAITAPVVTGAGTITDATSIVNAADATKKLTMNLAGNTTAIALTVSTAQTTAQTLSIPNITAADSVVTNNTTATLTNKTMTTPTLNTPNIVTPTVTGAGTITDANTFVNATTTTKKLALNLSGQTAATTLTVATAQTTSQTLSVPNITAADSVVTNNTTATLTNKTLTSPALNTPTIAGSGGALTLPAGPATLATVPAAASAALVTSNGTVLSTLTGTVGFVPTIQANGSIALSAPASGSKNYLTGYLGNVGNGNFEQGVLTSYYFAHSALSSTKFPTTTLTAGLEFSTTNGAPSPSVALSGSLDSTTQLSGSYSLQLSQGSGWTAGDMFITKQFTIDASDKGKVLTVGMNYRTNSGTFVTSGTSADSFGIFLYDVTNGAWISPTPSPFVLTGQSTTQVTPVLCQFQTSANGTKYQLAIIMTNAFSSVFSIDFDDMAVGPQSFQGYNGAVAMRAYVSSGQSVNGSTVTQIAWNVPILDTMSGLNTTTGVYTIPVSGLYTIGSFVAGPQVANQIHSLYLYKNGTLVTQGIGSLVSGTTDTVSLEDVLQCNAGDTFYVSYYQTSGSAYSLPNNSATCGFYARLVSGNQTISQYDGRVVAMQTVGAPTVASLSGYNICKFPAALNDTHGAYSSTTGLFTAPVSGYYKVSGQVQISATFANTNTAGLGVTVNGTIGTIGVQVAGAAEANLYPIVTNTVKCNAGDTIALYATSNATSPSIGGSTNTNWFTVELVSGAQQILPNQRIVAEYTTSSTLSYTANTPLNFDTKGIDTTSAVTTGASWKFTAPVSGDYLVVVSVTPSSGFGTSTLYKNGAATNYNFYYTSVSGSSYVISGAAIVTCNAGDYIDLRNGQNLTVYVNAVIKIKQI